MSTIMYLMALQEMISSPFRIVDEINQGMDERNERLVCDRIVQNCCGPLTSSQYFLITPKLLEALRAMDNDSVTVLIIFNGPGTRAHWDINKYIRLLKSSYGHLLEEDGDDLEEAQPAASAASSQVKRKMPLPLPRNSEVFEIEDSDDEPKQYSKKSRIDNR